MNAPQTLLADDAADAPAEVLPAERDANFRFSRQICVLSDPGGPGAGAIGALRTHLLAQHLRDRRRSLAVCGPSVGVGCTYIATNLAVALSLAGVRTLLIDANMRQPGLEALIAPGGPGMGLQQCLASRDALLGDAICDDVLPNLSLLYAGGRAENAQELLASAGFNGLIAACIRNFDLVVVDTPPSNTFADARIVSAVLRYAMIVTRRNETYVSDVKLLAKELTDDRAMVIGSFLNDY